jgi:hypothetical protein
MEVSKWSAKSKKTAKCPFAQQEKKQMDHTVKLRLQSVQLGEPEVDKTSPLCRSSPWQGTRSNCAFGEPLVDEAPTTTLTTSSGSVLGWWFSPRFVWKSM